MSLCTDFVVPRTAFAFQSAGHEPCVWPGHKLAICRDPVGKRFVGGVVLYDGNTSASFFGDELHAVPIRALWEAL